MAVYAYIRVSTEGKGQTTENQKKVIVDSDLAITQFFSEDGVSGSIKAFDRPAFSAMVSKATAGDTVVITMIDRLGRSASDVLNVVEELKNRGIKLKVMQFDGMDITSPMGKMILTCMSAMAELERNILIERTVAGLERTKAQGTKLGRPLTIPPFVMRDMARLKPTMTLDALAVAFPYPRNTIHRNLVEWGNKLDEYEAEYNARQAQYASNQS